MVLEVIEFGIENVLKKHGKYFWKCVGTLRLVRVSVKSTLEMCQPICPAPVCRINLTSVQSQISGVKYLARSNHDNYKNILQCKHFAR